MKLTFPLALGLLFIGLKLTGYIAWSWWLVLLPFWLPAAIVPTVWFATFVVVLLATANRKR